jgi:hypothetical protein
MQLAIVQEYLVPTSPVGMSCIFHFCRASIRGLPCFVVRSGHFPTSIPELFYISNIEMLSALVTVPFLWVYLVFKRANNASQDPFSLSFFFSTWASYTLLIYSRSYSNDTSTLLPRLGVCLGILSLSKCGRQSQLVF